METFLFIARKKNAQSHKLINERLEIWKKLLLFISPIINPINCASFNLERLKYLFLVVCFLRVRDEQETLWCDVIRISISISRVFSLPSCLINFSFINIFFLFHFYSFIVCDLFDFLWIFHFHAQFVCFSLSMMIIAFSFLWWKNFIFPSKLICRVNFSVIFVSSPWNYFLFLRMGEEIFPFCFFTTLLSRIFLIFSQISSKSLILLLITQHFNIYPDLFFFPKCTKL